jgi:hypothetical protein
MTFARPTTRCPLPKCKTPVLVGNTAWHARWNDEHDCWQLQLAHDPPVDATRWDQEIEDTWLTLL